jgi:hypothetical protein
MMHRFDKIIIHQPWGGLGDNLQFSTLPALFAAHGIRSYISTRNAVRSPEFGQLVWGYNPFIVGDSDEQPNAGSSIPFEHVPMSFGYIERIEVAHGLSPASRFPKVYYQPAKRRDLEAAILVDLGSVSVHHRRSGLAEYVKSVVLHYGYDPGCILQVRFKKSLGPQYNNFELPGVTPFVPRDIFEFCDALYSCKALITVHSGTQSLAVALRGDADSPIIHCYCTPTQFNGRGYIFPNVEYHVAENVLERSKLSRSILKRVPRRVRAFIESMT